MILRRLLPLAALALVLLAGPAAAHAELEATSHIECSFVRAGDELRLGFSEELTPGSVLIVEAGGTEIARAGVDLSDIDHTQLTTMIPAFEGDLVTVDYVAVSAVDDDVVRESFRLAAGNGDAESCRSASELDGGVSSIVVVGGATVVLAIALFAVARRSPLLAS